MAEHIGYIKDVQAGGSTRMVKEASEVYEDHLTVFIADTSDVQVDQVEHRAINDFGIPPACIYKKKAGIVAHKGIINSGLIISNKHPSSLEATWSALPKDPDSVTLVWDEPDCDAPNHNYDTSTVLKHGHLNKLSKHASKIHYLSATTAGLVVSDTEFTDIVEIENGSDYLGFDDCEFINLGDEDVSGMLKTGEMSPTLKNFIVDHCHEGIFIRACKEVADMTAIVESIAKLNLDVDVVTLNGETKHTIDPKTFKGILISFQMGARGVSFPHLKHTIQDYSATTPQPAIVQSMRHLGYGKKLTKNYIAGSRSSLALLKEAFKIEQKMKDILRKFPGDPEKRKEEVRNLTLDEDLCILPKDKSNGFKRTTSKFDYEILTKLPYTKEQESILIQSGTMFVKAVEGNGHTIKWGNRDFAKIVEQFLNTPPNSRVRLDPVRADYQRVIPTLAIQRIASVEEIASHDIQWGHLHNTETGEIEWLALFKKYPEKTTTYGFSDQT